MLRGRRQILLTSTYSWSISFSSIKGIPSTLLDVKVRVSNASWNHFSFFLFPTLQNHQWEDHHVVINTALRRVHGVQRKTWSSLVTFKCMVPETGDLFQRMLVLIRMLSWFIDVFWSNDQLILIKDDHVQGLKDVERVVAFAGQII